MILMSKKWVFIGLLAIIALAGFLRLWQIKTIPPGFYPDEAMNGNNALEALDSGGFKVFYPENNGREGLWMNMMAPFIAAFGNEPWVPRSLAAVFGILTVLGLYFLTRTLFGSERLGLLASFFLAVSFWHINFSRISFRAILAPFFLVWSFYFLWRALSFGNSVSKSWKPSFHIKNDADKKRSPMTSIILFGLSAAGGIFFGLGFHTYIAFRVAPLLLIFPFIKLWRAGSPAEASAKTGRKNLIFIFLLFALLAGLPLGLYFLQHPQDFFGRTSQVSVFAGPSPLAGLGINIAKTAGMFFWQGDFNWRHNFSGAPELWWPAGILFVLGIALCLKNCFRDLVKLLSENNFCVENAFLFSWVIVMLLPVVVSNEGIPHALRSIAVIPAVMIFAALGLDWIIGKFFGWLRGKTEKFPQYAGQLARIKKEFVLLVFVFLLAGAVQAFVQYFFRWAPNPNVDRAFNENYVELGRYLNTLPQTAPKYVIVNTGGIEVRGIPMPAQTTMFITKTFLPKWQEEKNIFYVNMADLDAFFAEAKQKEHLFISMLELDSSLRLKIKKNIPDLKSEGVSSQNIILYK